MFLRYLVAAIAFIAVVPAYAADIPEQITQLEEARQNGDAETIIEIVNNLNQADLAETPLTFSERQELRASLAADLASEDRVSEAIILLRQVVNDDEAAITRSGDAEVLSKRKTDTVTRLRQLAEFYVANGQPEQAITQYRKAFRLYQEIVGPFDTTLLYIMRELVVLQQQYFQEVDPDDQRLLEDLTAAANAEGLVTLGDPDLVETDEFQTVRVFYGSTRHDTSSADPTKAFTIDRIRGQDAPHFGSILITVPKDREVGSIPRPGFGNLRGAQDGIHVVLKRINRNNNEQSFILDLRRALENSENERAEAFVFVHGHATDFASAARRTAQLSVDLDIRHGGIFYAWPSSHAAYDYQRSQNNVEFAVDGLAQLLEITMQETDTLHVIAHSMGNRVLLGALDQLKDENVLQDNREINSVIWASPDEDATVFARKINQLTPYAVDMTLYASKFDRALDLSRWLGGDYPRAGQAPPIPTIAQYVEAVDTSKLSTGNSDFINHTDFAGGALVDVQAVIWLSLQPADRCPLVRRSVDNVSYWEVDPDKTSCGINEFRRAVSAKRIYGSDAVRIVSEFIAQLKDEGDPSQASWEVALRMLESWN